MENKQLIITKRDIKEPYVVRIMDSVKERKDWALVQKDIKSHHWQCWGAGLTVAPLFSALPGFMLYRLFEISVNGLGYTVLPEVSSWIIGASMLLGSFLFLFSSKLVSPQISQEEFMKALPEADRGEIEEFHKLQDLQKEYDEDMKTFSLKYFGCLNAELCIALGRVNKYRLRDVVNPSHEMHLELKKIVTVYQKVY